LDVRTLATEATKNRFRAADNTIRRIFATGAMPPIKRQRSGTGGFYRSLEAVVLGSLQFGTCRLCGAISIDDARPPTLSDPTASAWQYDNGDALQANTQK
jgi:hypothetical protein